MGKRLLFCLIGSLCVVSAVAAPLAKVKAHGITGASKVAGRAEAVMPLSKFVAGIYDDNLELPNYYLIFSTSEQAAYDKNTGDISMPENGFCLYLDMYNNPTSPAKLPLGIYQEQSDLNGYGPFTYCPDYTYLLYYENGVDVGMFKVTGPIVVDTDDAGNYQLQVTSVDGEENVLLLTFEGRINMVGATEKPTVYPQITQDINCELNYGGISFYQGISDYSRQGASYLNLYSAPFDEQGGMLEDGWNLCMLVAHKRFTKRDSYEVVPGEYTGATDLSRNTWYPCREIDYTFGDQTFTLPFGSYIRKRVDGEFTYAYLKEGTFTIVKGEDGSYCGMLDAVTDLGYHVQCTWEGRIALNTDNATFEATVSNLTDDVDLKLDVLDKGRVYHQGLKGGTRCFLIDLGSPSGKDEVINEGGDLMRFEFLNPAMSPYVQPGVYTVVLDRWNDNELAAGGKYEPWSLNKGYFSNTGSSTGTRYAHFKEGSYCVYDVVAPIEEGTVQVKTDDFKNYEFDVKLMDDAGFEIRGSWSGPIEYCYDAEALGAQLAGIEGVEWDSTGVAVTVDGKIITVAGADDALVTVYNTAGAKCLEGKGGSVIDASALHQGIYVLRVGTKTFKIVL